MISVFVQYLVENFVFTTFLGFYMVLVSAEVAEMFSLNFRVLESPGKPFYIVL